MSTAMRLGRGRPASEFEKAKAFLPGYLAGGSRLTRDIATAYFAYIQKEPRLINGKMKVPNTLERAKKELGVESIRIGTEWGWRDPKIKEPAIKAEATALEKMQFEVAQIKRRSQKPNEANGYIQDAAKPSVTGLDKRGFRTFNPFNRTPSEGCPSVMQVHERIKRYVSQNMGERELANAVFEWTYPRMGLSESTIAGLLDSVGGVKVPRAEIRILADLDTKKAQTNSGYLEKQNSVTSQDTQKDDGIEF